MSVENLPRRDSRCILTTCHQDTIPMTPQNSVSSSVKCLLMNRIELLQEFHPERCIPWNWTENICKDASLIPKAGINEFSNPRNSDQGSPIRRSNNCYIGA